MMEYELPPMKTSLLDLVSSKLRPVMVTRVQPSMLPMFGETDVISA